MIMDSIHKQLGLVPTFMVPNVSFNHSFIDLSHKIQTVTSVLQSTNDSKSESKKNFLKLISNLIQCTYYH